MSEGVALLAHLLGNLGPVDGLECTFVDDSEEKITIGLCVPVSIRRHVGYLRLARLTRVLLRITEKLYVGLWL